LLALVGSFTKTTRNESFRVLRNADAGSETVFQMASRRSRFPCERWVSRVVFGRGSTSFHFGCALKTDVRHLRSGHAAWDRLLKSAGNAPRDFGGGLGRQWDGFSWEPIPPRPPPCAHRPRNRCATETVLIGLGESTGPGVTTRSAITPRPGAIFDQFTPWRRRANSARSSLFWRCSCFRVRSA